MLNGEYKDLLPAMNKRQGELVRENADDLKPAMDEAQRLSNEYYAALEMSTPGGKTAHTSATTQDRLDAAKLLLSRWKRRGDKSSKAPEKSPYRDLYDMSSEALQIEIFKLQNRIKTMRDANQSDPSFIKLEASMNESVQRYARQREAVLMGDKLFSQLKNQQQKFEQKTKDAKDLKLMTCGQL